MLYTRLKLITKWTRCRKSNNYAISHHHYKIPRVYYESNDLFVSNVGSPNLLIPAITNPPERSFEQETFGACARRTTITTSSILRILKLALELRVAANPSLLFDTRTACRGNEARAGYVQRPTYSNEIRAANRERKGGNSVFPKAAITYGGITVKCAPLRREKWPLCGCSRLRSSDGFFSFFLFFSCPRDPARFSRSLRYTPLLLLFPIANARPATILFLRPSRRAPPSVCVSAAALA